MKKKTISAIVALVTAGLVLAGGLASREDPASILKNLAVFQSTGNESGALEENPERTGFPESMVKTDKEGITPFGYIEARVTGVIDGDTFHAEYKNEEYKVRMLDIDTPESVKSGVSPQPYSGEASEVTGKMLSGKTVKLIFEKGIYDPFDRLLAHVILEDGTYYNAFMVQNGYAISVFYSPNTLLREYFKDLQDKAIAGKMGFWKLPEKERPFIKDSKGNFTAAYKLKKKKAS